MRITEAARRLGTSARMLRYREELGLLPPVRDPLPWSGGAGAVAVAAGALTAGALTAGALTAGALTAGAGAAGAAGPRGPGAAAAGARGPAHRQFTEADLE